VGVSFRDKVITNGIERMAIGEPPYQITTIETINNATCRSAIDRAALRRSWEEALLEAMTHAEIISTPVDKLEVVVESTPGLEVSCSLKGGASREATLFVEALEEILDPIENPRYLIAGKTYLGTRPHDNYHSVPRVLGQKKEWAWGFAEAWRRNVGPGELIYTRSIEGRRMLLRARVCVMNIMAAGWSYRASCWK